MMRSVVVLLLSAFLVVANLTVVAAQMPNLKDFSDKLKQIPDKLKEVGDKLKDIPEKSDTSRAGTSPTHPVSSAHKVDINSASIDELKTLPGIDDAYAQKIVDGRPYRGTGELEARKILPRSVYDGIAMQVTARSTSDASSGASSEESRRPAPKTGPCRGAALVKGCAGYARSHGDTAPAAEGGNANYAAMRRAADALAMHVHSGLKLWRVDLRGWFRDNTFKIADGDFHYFVITGQLPTDHSWVSSKDVSLLRVRAKNLPGMNLPETTRLEDEMMVDRWQLVAVPSGIRAPEDIMASTKTALGHDPDGGPIRLRLLYVSNEIATSQRYKPRMPGELANLGVRGFEGPFFVRTAPHDAWIWWTVTEQDRIDPAANVKGPGKPRRAMEFVYVNAVTGSATSRCKGAGPDAIPC